MEHSTECSQIFSALAAAQGEINQPSLDSKVDFKNKNGGRTNYSYSSLGEVQKCIKEPNSKHGIFVTQDEEWLEDRFYVITLLTHSSGEWIKYKSPLIGNFQSDPKIFGAAKTYMRRYALYGIYNLYGQEDTDAQEIEGEKEEKKSSPATQKQIETIYSLLRKTEIPQENILEYISQRFEVEEIEKITNEQASTIIKKLIVSIKNKGEEKCDKIQQIG